MANRVPEFISLMRTIRDVYYKEMGTTIEWMKNYSNIFYVYVQQIKAAKVRNVTTIIPVDESTLGQATVVVDTTSDPSSMQFDFGIPAGLKGEKGDQGAGTSIVGSDTYANIILKTDALLGECWISLDAPGISPPIGNAEIGDGLVPLNDNPVDETEWINVGPIRGPAGNDGAPGQDGTDGQDGRNGEKWWIVPSAPSLIGDVPGSEIGDFALISNINNTINGEYYELFGNGWQHAGHLKGNTGDSGTPGSVWHSGLGVPSDTLGVNTDMYMDTSSNNYYYKSNDTWGSPAGNSGAPSVPVGGIISYSGLLANIPTQWSLCDGGNGTPNLVDRFIYGTATEGEIGDIGGSADSVIVSHSHTFTGSEMSPHSHDDHTYSSGGGYGTEGDNWGNNTTTTSSNSAGTPSGTISTDGVSGDNANLPPYVKLAYIMRIS